MKLKKWYYFVMAVAFYLNIVIHDSYTMNRVPRTRIPKKKIVYKSLNQYMFQTKSYDFRHK